MASLNKVMLIGNLGKDPELRHTASGMAVATFSIATSERVKNKQTNEWEKKTDWHNVVLWDKQATLAGQYLTKGSTVYIEGRLQTRKWQDRDGNARYTTEVVGSSLEFLSSKGEGSRSGGGDSSYEPSGSSNYDEPPMMEDDIPF
jgi:single-strand DNA-binding protein